MMLVSYTILPLYPFPLPLTPSHFPHILTSSPPPPLAIWDNRSAYHAATHDFEGLGLGPRGGQRATSLGERPYFDPHSQSRREFLKAQAMAKADEAGNGGTTTAV